MVSKTLTFPSYLIAFESIFVTVDSSASTVFPVGTVDEQLPHRTSWTLYGRSHLFKFGS